MKAQAIPYHAKTKKNLPQSDMPSAERTRTVKNQSPGSRPYINAPTSSLDLTLLTCPEKDIPNCLVW